GIGSQSLTVPFENGEFRHEIAWARTSGFLAEVEAMKAMGLIKGGSLENAVVYAPDGAIVNDSGARGADEPVRHKILDMLGDLATARSSSTSGAATSSPACASRCAASTRSRSASRSALRSTRATIRSPRRNGST